MGKTISLEKAKEANKVSETSAKKSATDKKNANGIKDKIRKERDVMYKYPGDCTSAPDKKKFRAAARKKKAKYEKLLKKEEGAKRAKALKNAQIFAKKTYSKGNVPEFA